MHVYEGFLAVPYAGVYEFGLSVAGVAELTLGGTVLSRVGAGEANVSRAATLPAGLVPFTLKLGKIEGGLRWRGPGMAWQPVLAADLFRKDEPVKTVRQADFLGHWSAARIKDHVMPNLADGGAAPLKIPEGTPVVDDPEVGKALRFEDAGMIRLERTGILANELTVSLRLKGEKNASLFRYGYAHTGIFADLRNGDLLTGGGRIFVVAQTKGGKLKDGKWHTATFTFGGDPVRKIQIYLDGALQAEGRSPAPCLTDNLEFLKDFTGELAEIRLYNRILSAEEIAALAR
jgi:hypothetical protein